jgi:Protein of unknown function (DUF2442)
MRGIISSERREEDRPVKVEFHEDMLQVTLKDGRLIATPLEWYPTLAAATSEQRANYELGLVGIHWPDIDEDLSVAGMLRGNRPPQRRKPQVQEG